MRSTIRLLALPCAVLALALPRTDAFANESFGAVVGRPSLSSPLGKAHWECWCLCLGTGHGPVVFEFEGKCDGTENGSGCIVEDGSGNLDMCVTVAEQDEE